jgi:hypothetical protein
MPLARRWPKVWDFQSLVCCSPDWDMPVSFLKCHWGQFMAWVVFGKANSRVTYPLCRLRGDRVHLLQAPLSGVAQGISIL